MGVVTTIQEIISLDRPKPKVFSVKRKPFNSNEFEMVGVWSILNAETDIRSTAMTELDIIKVQLVTIFSDGEKCVNGEERLKRLKTSDYIRLDSYIFLTLWENKHLIPKSWEKKVESQNGRIFFDGHVFLCCDGYCYVLYLHRFNYEWLWGSCRIDRAFRANDFSAVLAG